MTSTPEKDHASRAAPGSDEAQPNEAGNRNRSGKLILTFFPFLLVFLFLLLDWLIRGRS